jgi:hypothetical protein
MEEDDYGNVSFDGMKKVTMMFDERPSFRLIFARSCEEIRCNVNEPDISIEGLLCHIAFETIFQQLISIGSEDDWVKYVKSVMMNLPRYLDLVVRKLTIDHCEALVGLYLELPNASPCEAP